MVGVSFKQMSMLDYSRAEIMVATRKRLVKA